MDAPLFGEYLIKERLRQNEREKVYVALDPALNQPVTLKVIQSVPPGADRQLTEIINPLHHAYIVKVYKIGFANNDELFLAQESLTETLADLLLAQRQAKAEAAPLVEVAQQVRLIANALDYAHSRGVYHGSLNPASILLTESNEPVLTDFGLTAILGHAWILPAYSSPEQAAGQAGNALSDVYALGLILYEWVTGRSPFGDNPREITLAHHRDTPPPPPRTFNPKLPQAAEQALLKALAKSPNQRFASAGALAAAFMGGLTEAGPLENIPGQAKALPAKIGRYEIQAELGRRGNLIVYRARDPQLARQVALKVLPPHFALDKQLQAHFQREIELIAALEHPAIVQVYDYGEHEGTPFVVMPYLAGGTLQGRLRTGSISPRRFVPMIDRLAEALDEAHGQGLVHGRVRPSNILFDEQGQAYLSDFAISALPIALAGLTDQAGLAEATPYTSPEQVHALTAGVKVALDGRSDVYALGVILFEILTGALPNRIETGSELAGEPAPRLHAMEPGLLKAYQPIINRALAVNPADRYPSAGNLARHVREVAAGRWYWNRLADPDEAVERNQIGPAPLEVDISERQPSTASERSIGRYQIERELGRGGMAVVYLAYDPHLKRSVAVKVLPHQFMKLPDFQKRFQREAKLVARLQHRAIVGIYDFGEAEGQPFIVMPYLSGGTLAEQLQQGPLKLQALTPLIERVAAALDQAHAQHIIHHDVKPGNIIFNTRGEAFLSDFGIAVLSEATAAVSGDRLVSFTPKYVSPERVKAYQNNTSREVDGRSDVYSLGVVLFEALTGRVPFQAGSAIGTALAHVVTPVPRIDNIEPDLLAVLQEIIDRALAKLPADRYQTASELAQAVKEAASGRWVLRKLLE